jgi:4-amino-4-deoxy-L-arabinose transferase-like glycosyltransferase
MTAHTLGTADRSFSRLGPGAAFLLLLFVTLAVYPGQWTMPVTDRDEARYSQAATQMMETGDYIDIRFQEQPRYVKPAGIYWMQVAATQAFGGPDAPIGAYRLPSFAGILLASLGTAMIGARIYGGLWGAVAGGIFGFTLLAGADARMAKTDSMLTAAGVFAHLALFKILTLPKGTPKGRFFGWPLLFWFASGLAVLIKGPIITIMSVLTILAYVIVMRDWRALARLRILPGLLVLAVVGLTWVALITIQTDGEFLRESIGHALLGKVAEGDDDHGGWLLYHTSLLPVLFWPGSIFLGLAIAASFRRRKEPAVVFLLAWFLPFFVLYEIVGTKLPHYVLPVYPALALLCGLGLRDASEIFASRWRWLHALGMLVFALSGAALLAAAYIGIDDLDGDPFSLWNIALYASVVLTIVAGLILLRRPEPSSVAWAAGAAILFYGALGEGAVPRFKEMWPSHTVWEVASRIEGCEDLRFATAGYREPSNVFYLGTETELTDGAGAAAFLLEDPSCRVAIVDRRETEAFAAEIGTFPLRSFGTVTGTNVSKGRALELTIYVVAASDLRLGAPAENPRRL